MQENQQMNAEEFKKRNAHLFKAAPLYSLKVDSNRKNKMQYITEKDEKPKRAMSRTSKNLRNAFLQNYRQHQYNIAECCRLIQINRNTYYEWLATDKAFAEEMDNIDKNVIDLVARSYYDDYVKPDGPKKNARCQEFWLRTQGKKAGFSEKQEIVHSGEIAGLPAVQVNFIEITKNEQKA
jgi:hypothetical protein